MKPNLKKCIIILLLACVAPLSFAEQFYSLGVGMNFYKDSFPDDKYGRQHVATNGLISFYYFPTDFFLGVFAKASMGGSSLLTEQNERESMLARNSNVFELRFAASPSFRLKLGSKVSIPLSIGPSLVFNSERTSERLSSNTFKDYEYQAFSGGLNGDISLIFVPRKSFMLKPGIYFDYMFLRTENGQMRMNYRATNNAGFKGVPYSTFNFGFYLSLGMRI